MCLLPSPDSAVYFKAIFISLKVSFQVFLEYDDQALSEWVSPTKGDPFLIEQGIVEVAYVRKGKHTPALVSTGNVKHFLLLAFVMAFDAK